MDWLVWSPLQINNIINVSNFQSVSQQDWQIWPFGQAGSRTQEVFTVKSSLFSRKDRWEERLKNVNDGRKETTLPWFIRYSQTTYKNTKRIQTSERIKRDEEYFSLQLSWDKNPETNHIQYKLAVYFSQVKIAFFLVKKHFLPWL